MSKAEKLAAKWLGLVLGAAVIVVAGIYFLSAPHLVPVDESMSAPLGGIHMVELDCVVSDINVVVGGEEFKARLHGMGLTNEEFKAGLEMKMDESEPGALLVREKRNTLFQLGGGERLVLDVTVPESYAGGWRISSVSGDIYAGGLRSSRLDVNTASGGIELKNCARVLEISSLSAANISSTSGEIKVSGMSCDQLSLFSTSGNISAAGCEAGTFSVRETSGRADIMDLNAQVLSVSTTSGEIYAAVSSLGSEARLDSTSGAIVLTLPEEVKVNLEAGSVSGSVNNRHLSAPDGVRVAATTISGDITIK